MFAQIDTIYKQACMFRHAAWYISTYVVTSVFIDMRLLSPSATGMHNTGHHGARVLEQQRFTIPSFQISWEERFWRHPLLLHLQACGLNTIIDNNTVNVQKKSMPQNASRDQFNFSTNRIRYTNRNFHSASTFLFVFFK